MWTVYRLEHLLERAAVHPVVGRGGGALLAVQRVRALAPQPLLLRPGRRRRGGGRHLQRMPPLVK